MSGIKNILFDLGGVLLDIDYDKTTNAFKKLGFPHFENMYSQFTADQLFEKLEKGAVTEEVFYDVLLPVGNEGISKDEINQAWSAMLLDFRKPSFEFLSKLKNNYRLFLLSNTNAIHLKELGKLFTSQTGYPTLNAFFTKAYYSNLIGMRKPNENIYNFVLKDSGLQAAETFFIDDSVPNIEAAAKMGFKTHLLLPGEKIENLSFC